MIKAIRFEKTGGSDVLQYVDYDLPAPAKGQVQVRHTAIGVNFIDTYHRTGLYPLPLPSGLGSEAAGVVAALGEGVTRFKVGDRVGYASGVIGSYAQANNVAADRLVRLPDGISDELAAAVLLKGMTTPISDPPHPSGESGRDHRVSCRRRRCRPDRLPVGEPSGRHRDRLDHLAREGRIGQGQWLRPCDQHQGARAGKSRCANSPAARACRWSMTPSARTPSWPGWIACSRAASW